MADKFTIIDGSKDVKDANRIMRTITLFNGWERQYHGAIHKAITENPDKKIADYPQNNLMKIAFAGIKYVYAICELRREYEIAGMDYKLSLTEQKEVYSLIDAIFMVMGHIKLKNLVTTFPISKEYDGHKWQSKDYFYTMDVLSKMDWNKSVGREGISKLLWDYENDDLRNVYMEFTCAVSAIYREQTSRGLADTWLDDMGVPSYTFNKETGVIQNNQTGEIGKISKKPSYLKVVK